ncbi:MAG: hypothetical protein ABW072_12105 [Sedimenticola sp.]
MKEYQIFVSLEKDIAAPFIWVTNPGVPSRTVAKITNPDSKKHVYCEILEMDVNYRGNYNGTTHTRNITEGIESAVVNSWYRQRLGLVKNEKANLEITIPCCTPQIMRQIKAGLSHPDSAVRLACDLAVVSVLLGTTGLALGVLSLCG